MKFKKVIMFLIGISMFVPLYSNSIDVRAAVLSLTGVNIVSVDYSPTLNLFIAAANTDTTGKILISNDGINWGVAKSGLGQLGNSFSYSNAVQWWPEGAKFLVTDKEGKIYSSIDGYNWITENVKCLTNGGYVYSGGKLFEYGGTKIRIHTDLSTYKEINVAASGSYIDKVLCDGNNSILVIAGYRGWFSQDGGTTWTNKDNLLNYGQCNNGIYSPVLNKYLLVNDTPWNSGGFCMSIIGMDGSVSSSSLLGTDVSKSDNTNRSKAIAAGNNVLVIGFKSGSLYSAPHNASFGAATTWMPLTPAPGYISNINQVNDICRGSDRFVAVCNGATVAIPDSGGYITNTNYKDAPFELQITGPTRVEIPPAGSADKTEQYLGTVVDLSGKSIGLPPAVLTVDGILPNGVSFDGSILRVNSVAQPGAKVKLNGVSSTYTSSIEITLSGETSVSIEGLTDVAIPAYGNPDEVWNYTAKVKDQDGIVMNRTASITVVSDLPDGVIFSNGSLIVKYTSPGGQFDLKAVSDTNPSIMKTITIRVSPRYPKTITITKSIDSVTIPDTGTYNFNFEAEIKDQTNTLMPNKKVVWSSDSKDSNINISATGLLTVKSSAFTCIITVTASVEEASNLKANQKVSFLFSDLRACTEDRNLLNIDGDLNSVISDLTLAPAGANGTTIVWKSDNINVIDNSGKVYRQSDSNANVKLTATISRGNVSLEKAFKIVVLKKENILTNAGFEDSDLSTWKAVNGSVLSRDTSSPHSGSSALNATVQSGTGGTCQEVELIGGRTYIISGYFKLPSGEGIASIKVGNSTISSAKCGNTWLLLSENYTQKDNGNAKVKVTVEFSVATSATNVFLDSLKIEDITPQFDEASAAVATAEDSNKQSDISAAKSKVNNLPPCTIKLALLFRLSNISTGNSSGGHTGNGSGSKGNSGSKGGSSVRINYSGISVPPVMPDPEATPKPEKTFDDIQNHWSKDDVEFLASKGIIKGITDKEFMPEYPLTKVQFAALICRVVGLDTKVNSNLKDVENGDWYAGVAESITATGLMDAPEGKFMPNNLVNREEAAVTVIKAWQYVKRSVPPEKYIEEFSDNKLISSWAVQYIKEASGLGIIKGMDDHSFKPKDNLTRAQAASIIKRLIDSLK